MTAHERIERAEKELAEAKKMLAKEEKTLYWPDLKPGTFFLFAHAPNDRDLVKLRDNDDGFVYLSSGNRHTGASGYPPVIVVDIVGNPL